MKDLASINEAARLLPVAEQERLIDELGQSLNPPPLEIEQESCTSRGDGDYEHRFKITNTSRLPFLVTQVKFETGNSYGQRPHELFLIGPTKDRCIDLVFDTEDVRLRLSGYPVEGGGSPMRGGFWSSRSRSLSAAPSATHLLGKLDAGSLRIRTERRQVRVDDAAELSEQTYLHIHGTPDAYQWLAQLLCERASGAQKGRFDQVIVSSHDLEAIDLDEWDSMHLECEQ